MIIVHRNKDTGMGGYILEGDTVTGIHCRFQSTQTWLTATPYYT